MKKWLASSLMVVMIVMLLAACGGNSEKSSNGNTENGNAKVKLSLWHKFSGDDARAKAMRGIIEQFKQDNPNIDLEVQPIPPDGYATRIKTAAAANELPNIFILPPGTMTKELVNGKLIQPIDDLLSANEEWEKGFLEGSFTDFTVNGGIYSAPLGISPTSFLFYNKSIFDKYSLTVPKTWDELLNAIKIFNDNKITPIALGNKAAWPAQSSMFSSLADRVTGTEWLLNAAAQKDAKFTDPQFVQALTYVQDLGNAGAFQKGFNSIDVTQMEQMFAQGQAAMMIDGSWALPYLAETATKEVLDSMEVTVLPTVPGGEGSAEALAGVVGDGLAVNINASGAVKEAAYKLILALSGPEAQKTTLNASQLVSYNINPDESKVSSLFIKAHQLLKEVKLTPVYDIALTSSAADVVNNGLQEVLLGGKPADIAKKIQDAQARALLNQ
ncbi:extracellular solute-binding protein [Cohnella abietis]|uniref:ABC transporter substrate-binding protein n=1 Tax=Cohnella abietis TaxID=2507935 RepID=A0A3T1D5N9_9BACL|nr:extracellular solute-binding protein [Cohnella abietis]BBI33432.1 ABC transporter substrate-binding protein [Cohnella abietis]